MSVVLIEVAQQDLGEVERVLPARGLEGEVDLAILAHVVDIGRQTVTTMDGLEDLILIEQSLIAVVDDGLEAEVGLLPYQYLDLSAVSERVFLLLGR